jgi:hypothetical protein
MKRSRNKACESKSHEKKEMKILGNLLKTSKKLVATDKRAHEEMEKKKEKKGRYKGGLI